MKIVKSRFEYDFAKIRDSSNITITKRFLRDIDDIFESSENTDNPLLYEVHQFSRGNSDHDLNWGMTRLKPVLVGDECNMTKGHWHAIAKSSEIYFTMDGKGLLLLMSDDGNTWAEELEKNSFHYIPGNVAHRLINTGETELLVGACWPSDAGHNYEQVLKQPFGYRIKKKQGQIVPEKVSN